MLKPVIAATAVLAIAGSTLVYAQQRSGEHRFGEFGRHSEFRHRPSAQDMAAFTDARIAALKAGLELTPDQAKNWPAFEQALRDMAQLRIQRVKEREARRQQGQTPQQEQTPASPFERLQQRADNLAATGAALKKVAEAGAPLYQSLTDAQKERFMALARILRPHDRRLAFNDRNGWRRGGPGFGPGGPGSHHGHHGAAPNQEGTGDQPGSQL